LPKLSSDTHIDFCDFNFVNSISAHDLLETVIKDKKEIKICKFADSRDASSNIISKKIQKVFRKDSLLWEERGAKELFLGYPFVHGLLADGTPVRAPLVLFPIDIAFSNAEKPFWILKKRADSLPQFNKSFLLAYSFYTGLSLDENLLEYPIEEEWEDILSFKNFLYKTLKESGLDINFNSDLFLKKLDNFSTLNKEYFLQNFKSGQLILQAEAVLGIFPQAGSILAADYDNLIENNQHENLESFFFAKTQDIHKFIKEEQLMLPLPVDASQEQAIISVKKGNSLVVQGPPGTGKSQLICNLAADYVSRGKKVLIVCQKRAALDVVYERLSDIGLQDFTALVHDFKNDQKPIYEQITKQINSIDEYKNLNHSLDAIWLEREFLQISRNIDAICAELEELKLALFDSSIYQISASELYALSKSETLLFENIEDTKSYNQLTLNELLAKIKIAQPYLSLFSKFNFKWRAITNFTLFNANDKIRLLDFLKNFETEKNNIQHLISQKTGLSLDYDILNKLIQAQQPIFKFCECFKDDFTKVLFANRSKFNAAKLIQELGKISENKLQQPIQNLELESIVSLIDEAKKTLSHPIKKWAGFTFVKQKSRVIQLLSENNLSIDLTGVQSLKLKLSFEQKFSALKQNLLKKLSFSVESLNADELIEYLQNHQKSVEIFGKINLKIEKFDEVATLCELQNLIPTLVSFNSKLQYYFTQQTIQKLFSQSDEAINLHHFFSLHFDDIIDFQQHISSFKAFENEIIDQYSDIEQIKNQFYLAWIYDLETRFPLLKIVSTPRLKTLESELQTLILKKQEICKEITLLKVRDYTYKYLEFNRLNNRVTYRELFHQTTKKKKIWRLRKLIHEHKSEIFNLIPCWLASPETVSAIFPMEEIADLIIFDEASQCFAEKGIPAIARAKQVVVVGDDKQLTPNDLYNPRWEEENEVESDLEIDSLLKVAEKYLSQTMLKGHYRSRFPELISFSNQYFYDNKLKMIPHFDDTHGTDKPIEFIKLNGIWENNSNLAEAQKVIELLIKYNQSHPNLDIGIVTFNQRQQELIIDLVDEVFAQENIKKPERLFVKNIENVQGDERDIIIFSVGYAPDNKGNMYMQFGSLNQQGGENRLNVAISRAKQKIIIVSSILPHDLKTENSKNKGPELLQKYLHFALELSNENQINKPLALEFKHKGNVAYLNEKHLHQAINAKDFFGYTPIQFLQKNWRYEYEFGRGKSTLTKQIA
jgi:DNA polymerase IIIc chi subunit